MSVNAQTTTPFETVFDACKKACEALDGGFAIGEQLLAMDKPCALLQAIPSSAYPTPAKRPLNSRLDCSRLADQWHVTQPDWHTALRECLAEQG